jgi:hypothetical protein
MVSGELAVVSEVADAFQLKTCSLWLIALN